MAPVFAGRVPLGPQWLRVKRYLPQEKTITNSHYCIVEIIECINTSLSIIAKQRFAGINYGFKHPADIVIIYI